MNGFVSALLLQAGYNAALVAIGAGLLGLAAGGAGTFLFLRKRALVSDAVAHATLPGIGIAFLVMVAAGGDGRDLAGLMLGAAVSSALGLLAVSWITRATRLAEDAAIGAVLSVFFGFGIVLLTMIQTMAAGRQAGLEGFLLGATAGMLFADAITIALGGAVTALLVFALRRPAIMVAFDAEFAAGAGIDVRRIDLAMMLLIMGVTVIGLKIVGLVLIVALLIIPPVAARFWTEDAGRVALIAAVIGGVSGYAGAALSASAPDLPTGPMIVLVAFALFVLSMLLAPGRGVLAVAVRHRRFQRRVHVRQGLLALAQGQPIYEPLTLRLLRRAGLARADGVATDAGRAQAAKALLDENRWRVARGLAGAGALAGHYDGLTPIEDVLTVDQIAAIDARLTAATGAV